MSALSLHISTPSRELYFGNVDHVSLDLSDGRAGFMRGALPQLAVLCAGHIDVTADDESTVLLCGDGIVRVENNVVTVVTSYARRADEPEERELDESDVAYKYAKAKIEAAITSANTKKLAD